MGMPLRQSVGHPSSVLITVAIGGRCLLICSTCACDGAVSLSKFRVLTRITVLRTYYKSLKKGFSSIGGLNN